MCRCYGVTAEDVLLLLDYGYSADEIEEMLCDSNLLLETLCAVRCDAEFCCASDKSHTADKKKPLSHMENGFFFPNVKLKKYKRPNISIKKERCYFP